MPQYSGSPGFGVVFFSFTDTTALPTSEPHYRGILFITGLTDACARHSAGLAQLC